MGRQEQERQERSWKRGRDFQAAILQEREREKCPAEVREFYEAVTIETRCEKGSSFGVLCVQELCHKSGLDPVKGLTRTSWELGTKAETTATVAAMAIAVNFILMMSVKMG